MRGILKVARRPRPRSQAVLVGHNALERVVEYHGDQRIQVAELNLTVPAPRDLDAEVEIEVTEDKAEVVEADGEDDLLGEDHGLDANVKTGEVCEVEDLGGGAGRTTCFECG